jgi:hypothetical protein
MKGGDEMENGLLVPSRGNKSIRLLALMGQGPLLRHHKQIAVLVNPWRIKGMTLKTCCERLEAKGIRTFRGRVWSPSRLVTALGQVDLKK